MIRIENISHMLKIMCYFAFLKFFLGFLAFSRTKWFKLGLFGNKQGKQGIYYYVEMVRIVNTSHMLQIMS